MLTEIFILNKKKRKIATTKLLEDEKLWTNSVTFNVPIHWIFLSHPMVYSMCLCILSSKASGLRFCVYGQSEYSSHCSNNNNNSFITNEQLKKKILIQFQYIKYKPWKKNSAIVHCYWCCLKEFSFSYSLHSSVSHGTIH